MPLTITVRPEVAPQRPHPGRSWGYPELDPVLEVLKANPGVQHFIGELYEEDQAQRRRAVSAFRAALVKRGVRVSYRSQDDGSFKFWGTFPGNGEADDD